MKILQENDLLKYEEGRQLYCVTEKGLRFLASSNEINELLSSKSSDYLPINMGIKK
jgi:predicted transcriptional regulator